MKAITIKKGSWHYRAAVVADYDPDWDNQDICTYLRFLGKAALIAFAIGLLGLLVVVSAALIIGDFIAWLVYLLLNGWIEPYVGAVSIVLAGMVAAVIFGSSRGYKYAKSTAEKHDVVRATIDSLRHKICVPIKVKEP